MPSHWVAPPSSGVAVNPAVAPVFHLFSRAKPQRAPGLRSDSFLGTVFRGEYNQLWTSDELVECPPPVDEEYYEWMTLLTSVAESDQRFVFAELGAGYGRWSIRAAAAARMLDKAVQVACVEADPVHFEWLGRTLTDNGIDSTERRLYRAAVGARRQTANFIVGNRSGRWNPATCYGQALVAHRPTLRARAWHLSWSLLNTLKGGAIIEVDCVTIDEVIAPYEIVDLIDLDVQGAEYDAIVSSLTIDERVKRLYVETHSTAIEASLRDHLLCRGWEPEVDHPLRSTVSTDYGDITYHGGGAQVWRNPRLPRYPVGGEGPGRF